jgi:hypothetical protein
MHMNHHTSPAALPSGSRPSRTPQLPASVVLFKSKAKSISQTSKRPDEKTREEQCRWSMLLLNRLHSVAMLRLLLKQRLVPEARVRGRWRFPLRKLPTSMLLARPSEPRLPLHQIQVRYRHPSDQVASNRVRHPNLLRNQWSPAARRPVLPLEGQ